MTSLGKLLAVMFTAALALGLSAGPSSAALVDNLHFDESGSEAFEFCEGIEATVSWDDHVHLMNRTRGKDDLVHFAANVRGSTVFTNLGTGKSYTNVYRFSDRDQQVIDNGDGTLTITVMHTGVTKWYGDDGRLLFTTAGGTTFQVTVDHGGTPADPSDDEEVEGSFVVLKNVGRYPTADRDFCADLAEFTA